MSISLASLRRGPQHKAPRLVIHGTHGIGKALADDEIVLTPYGWRPIGKLKAGAEVCCPDGTIATITGVYPQGVVPLFILETSLGSKITCSGDHLWLTTNRAERQFRQQAKVRTTEDIAKNTLMKNGEYVVANYALPHCHAVNFCDPGWFPIPPYTMGVWLGDGGKSSVRFTSMDDEIVDNVRREISAKGWGLTITARKHVSIISIVSQERRGVQRADFVDGLRLLNLWKTSLDNLHIPHQYLLSSPLDRLAVLRGLMDTDGYASPQGRAEFSSSSKSLADDVAFLARSLGYSCKITHKPRGYRTQSGHYVKCREGYTVSVIISPGMPSPFALSRKANRANPVTESRYRTHFIKSVTSCGLGNATCIKIDHPDGLFLTRDFVVTHNSTLAASAPDAVFLPTEDGTDVLDVTSFPLATTEQDVLDAIGVLIAEEHEFQTVVIDTADWLESLIWRAVAGQHGAPTIEGTGERGDPLGYGKGYRFALDHWRQILEGLDLLRAEKGVMPIILAHSKIKRFDDPTTASYDRYMLDLHDSAAALLCEWSDIVGFLNYRVSIRETDVGFNRKIVKGKSGGDRVLYLEERPGFIAKSRYDLPDELQIPKIGGWQALEAEIAKAITSPLANSGTSSTTTEKVSESSQKLRAIGDEVNVKGKERAHG